MTKALTFKSTIATLEGDDALQRWRAPTFYETGSEGKRVLFIATDLDDWIAGLDDAPDRKPAYHKAERRGDLSSTTRVENFLDGYVAGKNHAWLDDYGQQPPLKRLHKNGLLNEAIWEVRLTQVRLFGWWAQAGILVLVSGGWTDLVHHAEKGTYPSPEWHADYVKNWRETHGYATDFWRGRDSKLGRALDVTHED